MKKDKILERADEVREDKDCKIMREQYWEERTLDSKVERLARLIESLFLEMQISQSGRFHLRRDLNDHDHLNNKVVVPIEKDGGALSHRKPNPLGRKEGGK